MSRYWGTYAEPGSLHLIYMQREFSIVYCFFLLSFFFQVPLREADVFMFRNHQFFLGVGRGYTRILQIL
jgi:hypothetical protein